MCREHSTLYMGEGKNPSSIHLLELAKKHGLKKGSAVVDEVKEASKRWREFARVAGVSRKSMDDIEKIYIRIKNSEN